jgi:hypothetical protein
VRCHQPEVHATAMFRAERERAGFPRG